MSIVLHGFFAWYQPFTNDEGAYLYDARVILEGSVPAGDVLTKAPVPIIFFAIGEVLTGKSLFAARVVNSIASIVSSIPLYFLLLHLGNKKTAKIGLVLWLLGSGTLVFQSMGHTQAVANLFAITCAWFFVRGVQPEKVIAKYILYAGVCFALAYASRKTAIAIGVPLILLVIIFQKVKDEWIIILRTFFIGIASICIPWAVSMYALYGISGIWHMIGGSYGTIVSNSQNIQAWAGGADHMFSEAVRIGFLYGLLLFATCFAMKRERVLIGASWVASLAILYYFWPTHLVEYLADFIPSIVIAGSVAITSFRLKKWQTYILACIFIFATIASLSSVYVKPWTGMFGREAVIESAQWLMEHVPKQEEIFTAAVIVPYISGHNVPYNLSHPQWYRYSFISEEDKNTFLPPYEHIQQTVQSDISWVLRDQLTNYAYPDINLSAFREEYKTPNYTQFRNNPLRVYLRQ